MKSLFQKYKHAWVFLYGFIYFPWFYYIEKNITSNFSVIQIEFDKKIPFIEHFIIPYYFWFVFMIVAVFYFFFTNKRDFYRLTGFLIIGMTLFLIISTLFPNGQLLRPTTFDRDNIFVDMVKMLYQTDTCTNVFPSIHVYNTLGVYIAIANSEPLKQKAWVQNISFITSALIILSTMFLKQHSVVDVIGAGIFAVIMYYFVYASHPKDSHSLSHQPI
ncbi:MAG: phosphatase PAP2 family protein [Tyzzerella sp.]|nr:phosphatase PAP2 family protein [Tyzzerella sp.]